MTYKKLDNSQLDKEDKKLLKLKREIEEKRKDIEHYEKMEKIEPPEDFEAEYDEHIKPFPSVNAGPFTLPDLDEDEDKK